MKKIGIILFVLGALITVFTGMNLSYTTRKNIVDAGDIQIDTRQKHSLDWPPFVGMVIMAVGGGAYLLSKRSLMR